MARLTKEQLEILGSVLHHEEIEAALGELMLDSIDNMELYEDFCRAMAAAEGDLTTILGKTHEPVGIEQFITDPYFLGFEVVDDNNEAQKGRHVTGVWKPVFDAACDIANGHYVEALLMGAIGIGKTTLAQIVTAYNLYLISTEHWPQLRFGLMPGSDIVITCLNVTDTLAFQVTYGQLRNMLEEVPYFNEQFPMNKGITRQMIFPRGVRVEYAAAYANKILGKNVIGGIVDELNFMKVTEASKKAVDGGEFNQASEIYHTLVRRLKSRYATAGKFPGCICLVSSKGYPDDFTETRKREVTAEADGLTYVFDKSQWEVRPKTSFKMEGTFKVEIGNARYSSRILTPGERPRENAEVIEVPMDFYTDFKRDLLGALRDFAGRTTDANAPYFYDRELIWSMVDYFNELGFQSAFVQQEIDFDFGFPDVTPDYELPNPDRPRSCHVDLALSKDCCGIAVGHVFKVSSMRVTNASDGRKRVEDFPHIAYDVVLTIRPPTGGQIEFAEVREFIHFMRDTLDIPIKWVTYDGFESVDSRQILRQHKFKTDRISVESEDVYRDMRSAMYFHKRLASPEHERAFAEFGKLQADYAKNRIDHPPKGSKDTCDAMTGVFVNLSRQRSSWSSTLRDDDGSDEGTIVLDSATGLPLVGTRGKRSGRDKPTVRPRSKTRRR